jgi:hypothetical protein
MYLIQAERLACFALVAALLIVDERQCGRGNPPPSNKESTQTSIRSTDPNPTNCTNESPQIIYGITIEDTDDPDKIVGTIRRIRAATQSRIAVRIVIDAEHDLDDESYKARIEAVKGEGVTIMALLADSHDLHKFRSNSDFKPADVSKYRSRIQKALTTLGSTIDVWEIGNEINGEWSGWKEKADQNATQDWEKANAGKREKSRQWVYNQVKAAYDVLQPANKCMAVTFYYNDDQEGHSCWPNPNELSDGSKYEMLTWISEHFTDKEMRDHIKYVFISYYENTECRKLLSGNLDTDGARFSNILRRLSEKFEKADVGFGEFGPECEYEEGCAFSDDSKKNRLCQQCTGDIRDFIPRYYRTYHDELIRRQTPRFIGGYFYWYGLQDMIPSDRMAVNELINALPSR